MNDKFKIITITENEEPDSGRKFKIKKFNAKTSLKTVKLLTAKILPLFDEVIALLKNGSGTESISMSSLENIVDIESLTKALDMISDTDMDKLVDTSLQHCFEILPAGEMPVLTSNGTFGVQNIEDDPIIVIRLTVEVIYFSVIGFFNASRSGSILKPLADLFQSDAST